MGLPDNYDSDFENNSFAFFGPMEMAFYDDGNVLDETDVVKISLSVILALTMVISIVGNICTCAVIAREKTMRTPTNCYLFNLAITDLTTVLYVPIEIYLLWVPDFYPFGEEGCRIHYILWDCLSNCSVLTITAFTIERYLVVMKPFLRQKLATKTRVYKIVSIIWVIAVAFCVPDFFYIDLLERKKNVYCYIHMAIELKILLVIEIFVFFVTPMSLITILYVIIALKLKSTQSKLRNSPVSYNQTRVKAVKMLAAVAALFFFCWAPFFWMRIMMIDPKYKLDDYYEQWRIINYVCAVNVYLSTAVNPIVYSLMSHKFRQAFKDFLKGRNSLRSRVSSNPASLTQDSRSCRSGKLKELACKSTT